MTKNIEMFTKYLNSIRNLNLRYRLILVYIPISLISVLVIGIISYHLTSKTLKINSRVYINETIKLICGDIDEKINKYEEICTTVSLDYDLLSVISDQKNDYNYYIKFNKVKQKLYFFSQNLTDIKSIFVYPIYGSTIIRSDNNIIYNDMNYKDSDKFYPLATDSKTKFWSTKAIAGYDPEENNYLYLLKSVSDFGVSNGLIQMQIREDSIFEVYKKSSFGNGSTIFITDSNGVIISHSDKK